MAAAQVQWLVGTKPGRRSNFRPFSASSRPSRLDIRHSHPPVCCSKQNNNGANCVVAFGPVAAAAAAAAASAAFLLLQGFLPSTSYAHVQLQEVYSNTMQAVQLGELMELNEICPFLASNSQQVFIRDALYRPAPTSNHHADLVASTRHKTGSEGSLGLLGCALFGFLFFKERQTRTCSDAALEHVQGSLEKAATDLCTQTRASVTSKSEISQLLNLDALHSEASRSKLFSIKSHAAELEQLLHAEGEMLQSLMNQEANLKGALVKAELECKCLLETIEQKQKCTEMQEVELHEVNLQLQFKEKQINSLKVALSNQDKVHDGLIQDYAVLESSLCRSLEYIKDVEYIAFKQRKDLSKTIYYSSSLNEELQSVIADNELTDRTLEESSRDLQDAKQAILNEWDHVTQSSSLIAEEMQTLSTKFIEELDRLKAVPSLLTEMTSQRNDLSRSFNEKRAISIRLKEQLKSVQEQLSVMEAESTEMHLILDEQFLQKSARQQESELCFEWWRNAPLEGQSGFDKHRAFRQRLTEESLESSEALRAENEISRLQDSIDLLITQIPDLLKGLGRLGETRKESALALKKEKRASAYARKRLAMCQEKLTEGQTLVRALHEELEQTRELLQHMEEQSSILSEELAKEDARAMLLCQDILQLKAELPSEQATHERMKKKVGKTGTVRQSRSLKPRGQTLSKKQGPMQSLQREADTAAVDGS